jgi:hypothetical protein
MNPFSSSILLSAIQKSSNALVIYVGRLCYECGEKGHYVDKCPQKAPKSSELSAN